MLRLRAAAIRPVALRRLGGTGAGAATRGTATVQTISLPEKIIDDCLRLRVSVQAANDRLKGPLGKAEQKNTILPFVFLLGNHSSGKSSFINYVCQRKVQTAGVAPTDDSFTIIVPGPSDVDRDGPAFVGDPDMGFSSLRNFGPQLVHHTALKVRSNTALRNFMLVDTPGMIDSPLTLGRQAVMDRGYDFEGVCRWYAERADVILLFFDPDKPGTTGETLQVLTNSLVGLEHKLHIILNKADQFRQIHDFARAYGSLCWNLSKVIQRKDLPRIYTMCLPPSFHPRQSGDQSVADGGPGSGSGSGLGQGLVDLEATREEVVAEVLNAPKRRVDNEISRLADSVSVLQMHCLVVDDLCKAYSKQMWRGRAGLAAAALVTAAGTAGSLTLALPLQATVGIGAAGTLGSALLFYLSSQRLEALARDLVGPERIEATFRRLYARRLADKDEYVQSLWARVRDHLKLGLSAAELQAMDRPSSTELALLDGILEKEVPTLRRAAAPPFNSRL